jgi:uncharacterized protein YbjQ (UPF0145 family)
MDMGSTLNLMDFCFPLISLILGCIVGKIFERNHCKLIKKREKEWFNVPALTAKTYSGELPVQRSQMAVGSVVVSVDHFKRLFMNIRRIFGGEVRSYSSLIDRGRREALLRMKESCPDADMFLNCRLQTATISSGKGISTGCVEVIAYSTALHLRK